MTLQPILASLYPTLTVPLEISTLIQSWAGTVPGEFRNIKKGVSFLNSILGEIVEEENNEIGYEGICLKETNFVYFKHNEGGGSFESPVIEIQDKYVKKYLYNKLLNDWGNLHITNEYSFTLVINLMISSQIIRNLVRKINALVYERKAAPLNLSFQQAVKRREIYDDTSNPYPMGPWSDSGITSSRFRIMVNKSAVCPVGSCSEYFTKKELQFYQELPHWYLKQQDKARNQYPCSQIY